MALNKGRLSADSLQKLDDICVELSSLRNKDRKDWCGVPKPHFSNYDNSKSYNKDYSQWRKFTWDARRKVEGENGVTNSVGMDGLGLGAAGTPLGAGPMSRHFLPRPLLEEMSRRFRCQSHTVSVQDMHHAPDL